MAMKLKQLVKQIETNQLASAKHSTPFQLGVGDTIRIEVLIEEITKKEKRSGEKGDAEARARVQPYEGVVIALRGGGLRKTVTVRRVYQGVGVERVFFVHSPCIKSINVKRRAQVRRSKLYYLRSATGRKGRL